MDEERIKEEIDAEWEAYQVEKWERSGSKDDFRTWQLKRYVDERIRFYFLIIIGAIIGAFIAQQFL
jgi:hypothetical protein